MWCSLPPEQSKCVALLNECLPTSSCLPIVWESLWSHLCSVGWHLVLLSYVFSGMFQGLLAKHKLPQPHPEVQPGFLLLHSGMSGILRGCCLKVHTNHTPVVFYCIICCAFGTTTIPISCALDCSIFLACRLVVQMDRSTPRPASIWQGCLQWDKLLATCNLTISQSLVVAKDISPQYSFHLEGLMV